MKRKDFQIIADVLKRNHNGYKNESKVKSNLIEELALDFAHSLRETNPRFNIQRFLNACFEK